MGYVICTTNNTDVMRTWDTKRDTSNNDLENMTCSNLRTAFVSSKILFKCPTPSQNPHVLLTFDLVHNPLCLRRFNVQKWRAHVVLCRFWLGNALRATTACTFSTSQLRKVVRHWCALYILAWKCASRHNGVQFFISHLASWLRTRRFSEPIFRPSGATNHWKNTVLCDFPTFSRWIFFLLRLALFLIFFLLLFSSLTLPISAFHLSILSEIWLLNFLRWYLIYHDICCIV